MPLDPRIPLQIQHFSVEPMLNAYYDAAENKRRTNAQRLADMAAQQQLELNEAEISEMFRKRKEAEELRKILGEAYGLGPERQEGQPGGGFQGYSEGKPQGANVPNGNKSFPWMTDAEVKIIAEGQAKGRDIKYGDGDMYEVIRADREGDIPGGVQSGDRVYKAFGSPHAGHDPEHRSAIDDRAHLQVNQPPQWGLVERPLRLREQVDSSIRFDGVEAPPDSRPTERVTPNQPSPQEPNKPEQTRTEAKPETPKRTSIPGHLSEDQIRRIGRINPEMAGKIRREQQAEVFAAEKATLEQKKGDADLIEKQFAIYQKRMDASREMLVGILNIPEADRPAAYQRALFSMQKMGIDIGQMPTRYNEAFVKEQVAGLASFARTLEQRRQEEAEKRAVAEEGRKAKEFDATFEGKKAKAAADKVVAEKTVENQGLTPAQKAAQEAASARDKKTDEYRQQQIEFQRKRLNNSMQRAQGGGGTSSDVGAIADAIEKGMQPPDMARLYKLAGPIKAELQRRGFDLAKAELDWKGTQRHLATLNGPQQERLRQAVSFTAESTDIIEDLYKEWKELGGGSGFRVFNKAAIATSKQVPGKMGAVAQALEAQVNDLVSELATVYKGGNSSTDESLKLAAANLKADWGEEQFSRALGLIRKNLKLRQNSINNSAPQGVRENNPYVARPAGQPSGGNDPMGIR